MAISGRKPPLIAPQRVRHRLVQPTRQTAPFPAFAEQPRKNCGAPPTKVSSYYRENLRKLAEAVRFELTEGLPLRWFSRPVH